MPTQQTRPLMSGQILEAAGRQSPLDLDLGHDFKISTGLTRES